MRAPALFLVAAIAGCHPSATIQSTMPIANLQSYSTVSLRVKGTAFASQGQAMFLENAVLEKLQRQCQFAAVVRAGGAPADVMLDLNIIKTGRGGDGWINNNQQAVIETLLVISDGQNGELLGSAHIRGKSSGMIINNRPPENEAVDIVAQTVANTLAKSGCKGPRIAKVVEPPPPSGTGSTGTTTGSGTGTGTGTGTTGTGEIGAPVDDARRAQAEQLNESGKEKLRGADLVGALADFQRATQLVPDARYQYNVCLAYEAQEQWQNAISACKQARTMTTEPRLVSKIDHRLELLAPHH